MTTPPIPTPPTPAPIEFALPERAPASADGALMVFLRDNPDVALDVSLLRLRRLDTPLVQLLLAAAADRRARGVPFRLTGVGADQAAQLSALGVTDTLLCIQGTA